MAISGFKFLLLDGVLESESIPKSSHTKNL